MATPDKEKAKRLLAECWNEVLQKDQGGIDPAPEVDERIRSHVRDLMSSETVSFLYCLPTQLLGKLTDPELDALCLQRGDNAPSQWDPRSFATNVVVPWVRDNENVLGTSPDPYVSNPLRQPRILPGPPNVRQNTLPYWRTLHAVLSSVEERNDPAYTLAVFREVLFAIHDELKSQQFEYPILPRISMEQMRYLVRELLAISREGEHAMSLTAALLRVIGRRFGLWDDVLRQTSTTSDRATGMVGDLECRNNGQIVYAVEVKEQKVTLADVRSFENKLIKNNVTEALINAPTTKASEGESIENRIRLMWSRGINLYLLSIEELVSVTMSLAGEKGRLEFVEEVGKQLDEYARPTGRFAWRDLLSDVLDGAT